MEYSLLNKIVLFVAQDYIYRTKQEGNDVPPDLHRLEAAVKVFKRQHMFTIEEAERVLKIASSDEMSDIMNKQVSFIVFVYELMKLWVNYVPKKDRPLLNISDKKFKMGGRVFWRQMLSMKQLNVHTHKEKSNIIEDSISVANEFFEYHKRIFNI